MQVATKRSRLMTTPSDGDGLIYPDSDGRPMSDNTEHAEAIRTLFTNVDRHYRGQQVFVGNDLLVYPVRGQTKIRQAPDVMAAFGRPPGYRGSYKIWQEENVPPHVVFEVLSPKNTRQHMVAKCGWYNSYGGEEFYYLHPRTGVWVGFVRGVAGLVEVPQMNGFVSPRLGMRFETVPGRVGMFFPNGQPFLTVAEVDARREQAERDKLQAERDKLQAERRATLAQQQVQDRDVEIDRMRREIERLRVALPAADPPE